MTMSYQQLTYAQRCQISALKKSDNTQREIADIIGASEPTVGRELLRNSGSRGDRYNQAQNWTVERRKNAMKPTKMTRSMIKTIEFTLGMEWSPEQISGWLSEFQNININHEAIYLHVLANKKAGSRR